MDGALSRAQARAAVDATAAAIRSAGDSASEYFAPLPLADQPTAAKLAQRTDDLMWFSSLLQQQAATSKLPARHAGQDMRDPAKGAIRRTQYSTEVLFFTTGIEVGQALGTLTESIKRLEKETTAP